MNEGGLDPDFAQAPRRSRSQVTLGRRWPGEVPMPAAPQQGKAKPRPARRSAAAVDEQPAG